MNDVHLVGTVSGAPQLRTLPSGDELVSLRLVVRRPPPSGTRKADAAAGAPRRTMVDTIDVACWSGQTRRVGARLEEGDSVEVRGALRRRFFATPGGRQSRYEVEAALVRRAAKVRRPRSAPSADP